MPKIINFCKVHKEYDKYQNFNKITRFLHGRRYAVVRKLLAQMESNKRTTIIDVGCGTATVFGELNGSYCIDYYGIENCREYCEQARRKWSKFDNFHLIETSAFEVGVLEKLPRADVVLILETLEHLSERDVFVLVQRIADLQPGYLVASFPVEIGPALWLKNVGSKIMGYVRHKEYTWMETFWLGLYKLDKVSLHQQGHKGSDWRWLVHTIRLSFHIHEIKKSPFSWVPAWLAASIIVIARPRAFL